MKLELLANKDKQKIALIEWTGQLTCFFLSSTFHNHLLCFLSSYQNSTNSNLYFVAPKNTIQTIQIACLL
jgi:hypothetical protein